jgi:transposase InsO family protein
VPLADIEEQKLRNRIRELAQSHLRWGRRLVYRRLRVEGWEVNHKRVQRIWREEELQRPCRASGNALGHRTAPERC